MKPKELFHLNILKDDTTAVYVILPEVHTVSFEVLAYCINFLEKYQQLTIFCSLYELSFYKLLLYDTATFKAYKNVKVEVYNNHRLKEIQSQKALIISMRKDILSIENHKKAICCTMTQNSDLQFVGLSLDSKFLYPDFLKSLLRFISIPENRTITSIDICSEDILRTSPIASKLPRARYSVLITDSLINSFKITRFLKKNTLRENLLVISTHAVSTADKYLSYFHHYDFLDYLAFHIQAKHIFGSSTHECRNICHNLRMSLTLMAINKEMMILLREISVPKEK